jgi:hypothetical protein
MLSCGPMRCRTRSARSTWGSGLVWLALASEELLSRGMWIHASAGKSAHVTLTSRRLLYASAPVRALARSRLTLTLTNDFAFTHAGFMRAPVRRLYNAPRASRDSKASGAAKASQRFFVSFFLALTLFLFGACSLPRLHLSSVPQLRQLLSFPGGIKRLPWADSPVLSARHRQRSLCSPDQ